MRQSSILDIISPVMVGPSSSHTAGAVRLGLLARKIYGRTPEKVTFKLYNSYALTGKGHGTDKGLLAGVLGFGVDDTRIKDVFSLPDLPLKYEFEFAEDFNRHPNAVDIIFQGGQDMKIQGDSVGAGEVVIRTINGFCVNFTGAYNTLLLVYKDVPGMIAKVTDLLRGINIATLHCDRNTRGQEAFMGICLDGEIDKSIAAAIEQIPDMYFVRYVEKL